MSGRAKVAPLETHEESEVPVPPIFTITPPVATSLEGKAPNPPSNEGETSNGDSTLPYSLPPSCSSPHPFQRT